MPEPTPTGAGSPIAAPAAKAVIISSVMFVFISYWRVAAIVLCDLASTAYYIGGIVEHSIGPAAPWFILAVMVFSYAVRSVYIESCSMFVRGGVYRIVKEALGGTFAKIAVSALLFDYVLTGPISGVSAGQYVMSLILELVSHQAGHPIPPEVRDWWKAVGSVAIACAINIYFFRLNVIGIHESSDKALKIMIATTVMGVTILGWSLVTLAMEGPRNSITFQPTFEPKQDPSTGAMESPLGFLEGTSVGDQLVSLHGPGWFSLIGVIGFFLAFGHSVLAMSGEETLAQIYREIESPKLKNFQRAALIVFVFSLLLTAGISILAVLLIPDDVRMSQYSDNLIGGLAMNVVGPPAARLILNMFVVAIGSLILAGAVNTAIIGSNGVLNRVAEDGVIPDWFLKPHPRFGTTYRMLYVILGLQLATILASRGNVLLLGEAYAFGVVWSFVFNCLAMLVLRWKEPDRARGFKVPLNIRIRGTEIPVGLALIFLILLISAVMNVLTKEIATKAGLCFTLFLYVLFAVTEYLRGKRQASENDEHLDQFNQISTGTVTAQTLGLKHQYRKLVALRSAQNLDPLDKALQESDPQTTDVVAMKAQVRPLGGIDSEAVYMDRYEQQLLNAIEKHAETAGKTVVPVIVSTNNAMHAVLQTAIAIGAQEVILGTSERMSANEQFDYAAISWEQLQDGTAAPLTVRIIGGNRDLFLDLAGGNRIPNVPESVHGSIQELRSSGTGVDHVVILHDGSPESSQLVRSLVSMLDSDVLLDIWSVAMEAGTIKEDVVAARRVGRDLKVSVLPQSESFAESLLERIRSSGIDLVVARQAVSTWKNQTGQPTADWADVVVCQSKCQVLFAAESSER